MIVTITVVKKQANPGPGTVSLSSNASKSGPSPLLTGNSVSITMYWLWQLQWLQCIIKTQIMTTRITMMWRPWWWQKQCWQWWWQKQCWQWWWQKSDSDDNDEAKKWWQWWCQKIACDGEVCSHSLRPPDWGILASSHLQLASTQSYSSSGIWRPSSSSLPTSSTALNTFLCSQSVQLRHQRQNLTNKNKKSPGQPQSTATLLIFENI